jgi:hypothetical protein
VPYNTTVDELIKTTNKNYYSKFKVEVHTDQHRTKFTFTEKLRAQVTSLLSRLHQEYFPNEPSPFGSKTNTPRSPPGYSAVAGAVPIALVALRHLLLIAQTHL